MNFNGDTELPITGQRQSTTGGGGGTSPSITAHPQSRTVNAGASVTFSVTATGTAPLRYQWKKAGTPIAGATNDAWTIASVQATDAGSYTVTVSNSIGFATSDPAVLTVSVAPVITAHPQGGTNYVGSTLALNVSASGTAPLAYQWRKAGVKLTDGGRLSGATSTALRITDLAVTDAGAYDVVVTNIVTAVTSQVATVTVTTPQRTVYVENVSTLPGVAVNVSIKLLAQGNENTAGFSLNFDPAALAYQSTALGSAMSPGSQLLKNTNLLGSGKLGLMLALPSGEPFAAGTRELAVVTFRVATNLTYRTNLAVSFGNQPVFQEVGSSDAEVLPASFVGGAVEIGVPPSIVTQPTNQVVNLAQSATFSVTASGMLLNYQWRFNGADMVGRTNASLILSNAQPVNEGDYCVVVANFAGAVTSTVATSTVILPPTIVADPQSRTVPAGTNVSLTVTASGSSPAYQWLREGVSLSGATQPTLTYSSAQTTNSGRYQAIVSNSAGAVTSAVAVLTVIGGYEGDVAPRPNGNGSVSAVDWTQVGLFASGLASPTNLTSSPTKQKAQRIRVVIDFVGLHAMAVVGPRRARPSPVCVTDRSELWGLRS